MSLDPLEVLERIHRDVRLLRELGGDALVITLAPVPTGAELLNDLDGLPGTNTFELERGVLSVDEAAARVREQDTSHGGGHNGGPSLATRDLAVSAKEYLAIADEPMSPADLRDRLGLTIKGFAKVRAILNDDPHVEITGSTRQRRYALRSDAPTASRRQRIAVEAAGTGNARAMPKTGKAKRQEPKLDGQIMAVIQLLPRCASEIAHQLSTPLDLVLPALRRLEADGDVRKDMVKNTWMAVP